MSGPRSIVLALLLLTACNKSDHGGASANGQERNKNPTADNSRSIQGGAVYYIHCIGRDIHLKNYQPAFSTSLQILEFGDVKINEINSSSYEYYPICDKSDKVCKYDINSQSISFEVIENPTESVEIRKSYFIDRISGEFFGSEYAIIKGNETERFRAVGTCKRSSNPSTPSAI